MHTYKEHTFNIPNLIGISPKQLEVHLGLYAGYVKHVNLLREKIHEYQKDNAEKHAYTITELRRRFAFEFDGMRMHEYYFEQWERGSKELSAASALEQAVSEKYGNWNGFIGHFKEVGMSRGIGWTILYQDPEASTMHVAWVSDHELGQLGGLPVILAMDMWEHAFMVDYLPSEKKQYVEAFLANTNWSIAEKRFIEAT